jgi:hypothetical protein
MRADSVRPGDHIVLRAKPNRASATGTVLGWLLTRGDGTTIPLHVRAVAPTRALRRGPRACRSGHPR